MSSSAVLQCRTLSKRFEDGANRVEVLHSIDLSVAPGEKLAIIGASGSGKSTLLQLMGGLDRPSSGEVLLQGQSLYGMSENRRSRLRGEQFGFIYQFHHLLPEFTALENVMMPLWIQNRKREEAEQIRQAEREEEIARVTRKRCASGRTRTGHSNCRACRSKSEKAKAFVFPII